MSKIWRPAALLLAGLIAFDAVGLAVIAVNIFELQDQLCTVTGANPETGLECVRSWLQVVSALAVPIIALLTMGLLSGQNRVVRRQQQSAEKQAGNALLLQKAKHLDDIRTDTNLVTAELLIFEKSVNNANVAAQQSSFTRLTTNPALRTVRSFATPSTNGALNDFCATVGGGRYGSEAILRTVTDLAGMIMADSTAAMELLENTYDNMLTVEPEQWVERFPAAMAAYRDRIAQQRAKRD